MNRYVALLIGMVIAGALVTALVRAPRPAAETPLDRVAVPTVALKLALENGVIAPVASAVPKDHRVVLHIVNRGARAARVTLTGYEDRVAAEAIVPGGSWSVEFLADRPGDDFAWLVDGEPAGRLSVQGSHLVEGHR